MKKTKTQKGITLIALIITIVVLLILAVVAIRAVRGNGIIEYAKNAASDYEVGQDEEEAQLQNHLDILKEETGSGGSNEGTETGTITVAEAQTKGVLSTSNVTDVKDEYGNIVRVPAGFKITTDANNVTEGIVIEDCTTAATKGSQFVWIPVGIVYKNAEQTESKTINLDRYTFEEDGTATPQGDAIINNYYLELATSDKGNATAKDLNGFLSSTKSISEGGNGGYYLGRYEAGKENDALVCKVNQTVYLENNQPQASSLSRGMYEENSETNVISDLINSYAWDTAIVFIQTFSTEADAGTYSRVDKYTGFFTVTGGTGDEFCNINDMAGNAVEWSTETCRLADITNDLNQQCPFVFRGYHAYTAGGIAYGFPSDRSCPNELGIFDNHSFRPLLYW